METEQINVKSIVRRANRSEIHRRTGLSLSHVSRCLSGGRMPKAEKLAAIAAELGLTMDQLYTYLKKLRAAKRKGTIAA